MHIKPALHTDIPKIAALWHSGWHQAHAAIAPPALTQLRTADEFAARTLAHLGQTQAAWIDGQIVGFFMLVDDEIYQFYVDADFRGTGTAAKMMTVAEAALGDGLKWLACSVGNDRAAQFYHNCGWARTNTIPYEVETGQGPQIVNVWRYEKTVVAR